MFFCYTNRIIDLIRNKHILPVLKEPSENEEHNIQSVRRTGCTSLGSGTQKVTQSILNTDTANFGEKSSHVRFAVPTTSTLFIMNYYELRS